MSIATPDAGPLSGHAILVVDDEAPVRRLLSLTLTHAGYEVAEASDGPEALRLATEGPFALVLLDNRMPRLSGLDVLRELRDRPDTRTLPVILITGADELADRIAGLDAGATDYITKPFDLDEVLARVRAQLRGQHAWQEVFQAQFRERSAVARALSRASTQPTLELASEVVCDELTALRSVVGATLVWFADDGVAMTLASNGPRVWGLRPSGPAPAPLSRYLRLRADIGPWVERADVDDPASFALGAMVVSSTLVCAPLGGPGHALGLLLLATERMATSSQVAAALSAAIDFAGVATSLLRPGLEERRREQQQRLGLATVLLEEAFVPHFQPVVELAGDGAIGFEALTRFTDGTSPEARFAEAAKLGLGPELEQATLRAALAKAATLPGGAWLSLNVSPAMILATPTLRQVLRAAERPIVLEISEHEPIDDYAELKVAVDRLGRDVSIAVDDVGSGFASLRHVLILQPSFMKLDPCWIRAVEVDPGRQALIQGLVSFAAKTDCQVIAEGIETEEERAVLVELGVRLGQGFLLGMPKPSLAKVTAAPASR